MPVVAILVAKIWGVNLDKTTVLAIGKYLQENVVCSPADIQHFLVVEYDYVHIPLKNVREVLETLEVSGFLEKTGEVYSPRYFTKKEPENKRVFDGLPVKNWHREMLSEPEGKDE